MRLIDQQPKQIYVYCVERHSNARYFLPPFFKVLLYRSPDFEAMCDFDFLKHVLEKF
jgi:hypothetical protein